MKKEKNEFLVIRFYSNLFYSFPWRGFAPKGKHRHFQTLFNSAFSIGNIFHQRVSKAFPSSVLGSKFTSAIQPNYIHTFHRPASLSQLPPLSLFPRPSITTAALFPFFLSAALRRSIIQSCMRLPLLPYGLFWNFFQCCQNWLLKPSDEF